MFPFHPDLIETLVARGEIGRAEAQLVELEACAERFPRSWAVAAGARTPADVVSVVYADVDRVLWPAAELSVRAQLDYLGVT